MGGGWGLRGQRSFKGIKSRNPVGRSKAHRRRRHRNVQPLLNVLHDGAVLGVVGHQLRQRGEPKVAADIELSFLIPNNPEVVHTIVAVQKGQDKDSSLAAALTDEVSTWSADSLQSLAGNHPAHWSVVPPMYIEGNSNRIYGMTRSSCTVGEAY